MDQQSVFNNSIWKAIQQLKAEMVSYIDTKMNSIQSSLQTIQSSLSTLGDPVSIFEQRVSSNEGDLLDMKKRIETLERDKTVSLIKTQSQDSVIK